MTLGSALPWRACSTLGRIQHQHLHRLLLPALSFHPRKQRLPAHSARARSTASDIGRRPKAHAPTEHAQTEPEPSSESSSLVDRLSRVPVRPHGTWDPVVLRPVTPYPHKREDREGLQEYHRALTQQARLENHRELTYAGDWRVILQTLLKWSPTYEKPEDGVKVIIPKQATDLLLSDRENNVWNIRLRTGCVMTLYRPAEDTVEVLGGEEGEVRAEGGSRGEKEDDMDPYIMLSGEPGAISAAIDEILKVTKRVTVVKIDEQTETTLHAGEAEQAPSAGTVAAPLTEVPIGRYPTPMPTKPYTLNVRADQIPRPTEWTVWTFQHYIAVLTWSRPHGSLARKLYPGRESHRDTVVHQLHSVFNDPVASGAVSLPALKRALEYLVPAGETYFRDAQALSERAESLGVRMDTDVCNLMAETSVQAKNMLAFQCTISDMLRQRHQPNARTWVLFLRLIAAEEVRRYILHAMHIKGLFSDPRLVNAVSVEMADHDIYRAVQLGQDVDAFLQGLRELYGSEWRLRTRAANRYLDVLGRYSKFDECTRLLEHMFESEHAKPNSLSLNTVLTHCKHQRRIGLAIGFVDMFDERACSVADQVTFHLLFEAARKTRKPHLLGAVWRYAHLVEMTNYRMRHRGLMLLVKMDEVLQLTDRIRGVWTDPRGCNVTKRTFIRNLLLCDYDITLAKYERLLPETKGQNESQSPQDPAGHPDGAGATPDAVTRAPDQFTRQGESLPSGEPRPVSAHDVGEEVRRVTVEQTPDDALYSSIMASYDTSPRTKALHTQQYGAYSTWASKKAQRYGPNVALGEFLQRALDRDRSLHKLAHEGVGEYHEGSPVDFQPVRMPLALLKDWRFELNSLPDWLGGEAKKREKWVAKRREKRRMMRREKHGNTELHGNGAPVIGEPGKEGEAEGDGSLADGFNSGAVGRENATDKPERGRDAEPEGPVAETETTRSSKRRSSKASSTPRGAWEELLRADLDAELEMEKTGQEGKATS